MKFIDFFKYELINCNEICNVLILSCFCFQKINMKIRKTVAIFSAGILQME